MTCNRLSNLEYSDKLAVTCDNRQNSASLLFYLHERRPHTVDAAKVAAMNNESVNLASHLSEFTLTNDPFLLFLSLEKLETFSPKIHDFMSTQRL